VFRGERALWWLVDCDWNERLSFDFGVKVKLEVEVWLTLLSKDSVALRL